MHKLVALLMRHKLFIFLILFVVLTRLPVLWSQVVPFQFDHGKDAIAVFHMWQTFSPKLIGPWTSIPGLFFGPVWYYLLLPGMIVSQGAPIASVVTMLILGLVTIWIAYRYFGKVEASILAFSSIFYTITSSAWNPFPMITVSFILLAVLKNVEQTKQLTTKKTALLGIFSALGFHFSTAFAVLYPLLILLSLLIKRIKISFKQAGIALVSFGLPFVPQLLFEVRHDFIEFRSVLKYLATGDSEPASLEKFGMILKVAFGEIKEIIVPGAFFQIPTINRVIEVVFLLIVIFAVYRFSTKKKYHKKSYLLVDAVLWFTIPLVAFTFLHFNVWYILPLLAMAVILVSQVLRAAPLMARMAFVGLFCVVAFSKFIFFMSEDKQNLLSKTTFLPNKKAALEYIYTTAGDKPFASYHFMPDIYDYPYQYLYFIEALHGKRLPTEFSYQPGETAYIPEKAELMEKFKANQDLRKPEILFYIVEGHDSAVWYDQWYSKQQYGSITAEKKFSENLTVYTATPPN